MKLPVTRLNILGDRYKVVVRRQQKEFGLVWYRKGLIELRLRQSVDQARDTLLHEVIHAIDHTYSSNMTEDQIRVLATGLRAVFTANPKFGKWVSE